MNFQPEDVLVALEEARRFIKALPPAEVPHPLRRTRGSSSRRLTPVEARTLYRALDGDEELRRATLDNWGPPSLSGADPRTAASVLFLERSENWESQARGYLAEVELDGARDEIERLRRRQRALREEIRLLHVQAERLRHQAEEEIRERTAHVLQDLARARERMVDLERRAADRGREADYWEKEANAAWDDLDEADRRYDDLRDRYTKARSLSDHPGANLSGPVGFSRDPLETARMLDQMVGYWQVGSDAEPQQAALSDPLVLPSGLDPKSIDAMEWIFFEAPRLYLVVDGWNAAHYWHYHQQIVEKPDAQTKAFITNKLENLVRYSVGHHKVSFYLDSRFEIGLDPDWASQFKSRRLTGFYVEDADDAIVLEVAAREGEPVVVITSDNGLAERCREHGAVRIYSEALAQWMAHSPV
ncbi:MAG: hypothetical protein OXC98_03520 [bacterium]|nr:NYN domain-containing protein [Acidimicrobiia bacterium]MCY4649419.1 hypothetical protein [bacterium]